MKTWIGEHVKKLIAGALVLVCVIWAIVAAMTHQGNKDIAKIEQIFSDAGDGSVYSAALATSGEFSGVVAPMSAAELVSVRQTGRRGYRVTYRVADEEHVTSVRASGDPVRIEGLAVRVMVETPALETPVMLSQHAVTGPIDLFPGVYGLEGFRRDYGEPATPLVDLAPSMVVAAHDAGEPVSIQAEPSVSAVGADRAEEAVIDHLTHMCPARDLPCPDLPGGEAARVVDAELTGWDITDEAIGHYGGTATLKVTSAEPGMELGDRHSETVEMEIFVDFRGKDVAVLAE